MRCSDDVFFSRYPFRRMFRIDSLIVEGDFLPLERLADDGQQSARVFSKGDGLVDTIFE